MKEDKVVGEMAGASATWAMVDAVHALRGGPAQRAVAIPQARDEVAGEWYAARFSAPLCEENAA